MALLSALLLETPFEWTPQGYRFQEKESRRRNSSEGTRVQELGRAGHRDEVTRAISSLL